jgi:plastocyanin
MTRIAIRDGATGVRFEPAHAALAAGGTITIVNESQRPHLLSVPAAGLVRPLATGDAAPITNASAGEWSLFLLDVPGEEARVFAAPGPFQIVSTSGRFALGDLAPGATQLHAWHPRFPPASRAISLAAGVPTRVDLELRVDRPSHGGGDAR